MGRVTPGVLMETEDKGGAKLPETDAKAIAAQVATLVGDINAIGDKLKEVDSKRESELAKFGKATEETGTKVATYGEQITALQKDLETLQAGVNERLGKIAPNQPPAAEPAKSMGDMFVESAQWKEFKANSGASKTNGAVLIDGYAKRTFGLGARRSVTPMILSEQVAEMKATLATTSATRLIPPTRLDMVGVATLPLNLWDIIPMNPYGGGGIDYVREVGFYGGDPINPSGGAGTWSGGYLTITDTAHGVREGQLIQVESANPAALDGYYRAEVLTTDTFRIRVPADPSLVDIGTYRVAQQHGAAAATAEASAVPEATWVPEYVQAAEGRIGHFLPITQQVRDDDAVMRAYLDDRIPFGVEKAAERAILYGSGVSPQWRGLFNTARVAEWLWSRGATSPVADTKIDAIRRAITVASIAEYPVTGLAISPEDNQDLDLVKGTDGHYIYLRAVGDGTGNRFFALPRVEVQSMVPGTALVGSYALGAGIWLRDQVEVLITDSHSDWFPKGILAVRAQLRGVFEVTRPEAFAKVTFDSAPVVAT